MEQGIKGDDLCLYWNSVGIGRRDYEEARQVIQALYGSIVAWPLETPDVVTAITMAKNDEIDKFVALLWRRNQG